MGTKRSWTDDRLVDAVAKSRSYSEVSRKLGLTNYGANSRTIKKHIARLEISVSHFFSKEESLQEARKLSVATRLMSYEDIFIVNDIDRGVIKRAIIRDDLIPYKCAVCGIVEWNGQQLSLHLDHINGVNNDNQLENLRFLCPNCHSLTDTYCGKQLRGNVYTEPNKCKDCGAIVHDDSTYCRSCASFHNNKPKIDWPPTSELEVMVEKLGYRGVGKKLGVTDNSVKKRIKNHPVTSSP